MGVVPWEMSSHLDSATIIHKICLHRALLFWGASPPRSQITSKRL